MKENNIILKTSSNIYDKVCKYIKLPKIILAIISLIILIISIIPLIKIAKYNHPVADDYDYGIITFNTWNDTHNVFKTIGSGFQTSKNFYNTWQGTYSATFLMSLNPVHFGFRNLGTCILIFSFLISTFYFLYVLLVKYLNIDKWSYIIVASIICFLGIEFSSSPVEAFYWWNGSVYYTFFYSLSLIYFGLILSLFKTKRKVLYMIILSILSIIIAGSNYTTCLINLIILFLGTLYLFFEKNKNYKYILSLFLLYLICFMVNALAPGNNARASMVEGTSAILAIIKSFKYAAYYFNEWTNLFTIICFIIIGFIIYPNLKYINGFNKHPLLFSFISICLFAAQFTPPLYAMSNIGEGRLRNIIHYSYYLILLFNLMYYINWFKCSVIDKKCESSLSKRFSINNNVPILILGILLFVNTFSNKETFISYKAYNSLKSGEASIYYNEYLERLEKYLSNDKNITVKEHTVKPYLLFFSDITEDSTHWQNLSVERFYHKDSVVLIKNNQD